MACEELIGIFFVRKWEINLQFGLKRREAVAVRVSVPTLVVCHARPSPLLYSNLYSGKNLSAPCIR